MVVLQSWALLKKDKEILWFPVFSGILVMLAYAVIVTLYFFTVLGGDFARLESATEETNYISYVFLFVGYLVSFLIVNFFQAGVMIIAHARFNGQDLGFGDGLRGAATHFGKIFIWSLISATVGVILRQIFERSQILGKIVATVLGVAWNILTYFSLPALILGNTSITGSFSESASIIRKTWGETIIVNVGVGLFFALLMILGVFVFLALLIFFVDYGAMLVLLIIALVVYLVGLMVISSALQSIFKTALYEYAKTGQVPAGFSPELIKSAIGPR